MLCVRRNWTDYCKSHFSYLARSAAVDRLRQVGQRVGFLDKGTDDENIFASLHDYLKYCAVIGVIHEAHGPLSWLMSLLPPNGIAHVANFTHHRIQEGQRRRASEGGSEKGQDFLSKSLSLHEANPEKFPEAAIQTLCLTNFGAGSDTTSISLCAILYNLISHPAALSKVCIAAAGASRII